MVSKEEKARRKGMRARGEKQSALKEKLLRKQTERRMREELGEEPPRPLKKLKETEEKMAGKKKAAMTAAEVIAPEAAPIIEAVKSQQKAPPPKEPEKPKSTEEDPLDLTGWLLFIAAIALWLSDLYLTGFNGIDIKFVGLNLYDILTKGFLGLFFGVFLFELIFRRPRTKQGFMWLIILDIILVLIIILTGFNGGAMMHLIFAFILWFALIKPNVYQESAYKTLAWLLFFDFVGFSLLELVFNLARLPSLAHVFGNRIIFPFYVIYLLFYLGINKKSMLASILLFLLLFSYVGFLVKDAPQFQDAMLELTEARKEESITTWGAMKKGLSSFLSAMIDPLVCTWKLIFGGLAAENYGECIENRTAERACAGLTGKEYESCINRELGIVEKVDIDKRLKATKFAFVQPKDSQKIKMYADNKDWFPYEIRYTSPRNPVKVNLGCKFQKAKQNISGLIFPEYFREFVISNTDEIKEGIFCQPEGEYAAGDYKIIFEANLQGVKTTSYLDRLFIGNDMEDGRKRELQRQRSIKANPTSGEELAVFSLTIGIRSEPFIYAGRRTAQSISGGIETLQKGKLTSVEKVEIDLRDPAITLGTCSPSSNFNPSAGKLTWQGPGSPILKCELNLPDEFKILDLKDQGPTYIYKKFQADMVYNYRILKEDRFKVEKAVT
ncbi:hypothetical protein GOV06_03610 [Candidatus Woesearchaeota archaeon]|nr:hypothetical protein [Candidatus Woesearchaeota archaeon]